jgi:FMN phosphatase YigB (HAD superfamily)
MDRLILTDADGVLLNWEWAFSIWMQERGFTSRMSPRTSYWLHEHYNDVSEQEAGRLVRQFNESAAIGFLPAFRDSVYYVKRLHEEHGFRFRVITSLSDDKNAAKLRDMNLRKLFGDAIEDLVCLSTGADKTESLLPFKDSGMWWIEDKFENAVIGHELGLNTIMMEHGHNMHRQCPFPVVKHWKDIYDLITP